MVTQFVGRQTERVAQFAYRTWEEGHDVQKDQVLHLHTHVLQPVHYQLGLPFRHHCSVQNEMQVECLGVMCYRVDLIGPGAQIS